MIPTFDGPNRFLSNFWPCKISSEGMDFPSVEHAYQAAKFPDYERKFKISKALTPGQAKRMGRDLGDIRPDWKEVSLKVMRELVKQKFSEPRLKELLLATGDEELQEGNTWGDAFWGTVNGVGLNHLGKILMEVRFTLKHEND